MNLDLLISKYLDGELTHEEDVALRELIKADPYSRSVFDDYIEIQMEIQKDAQSIKLPKTLKKSTEDIVMMEILKATPVVIHKIEPVVARRKFPQFLSMVAALLLFFVFSIYEYKSPVLNQSGLVSSAANRSDMPVFEGKNSEVKEINALVKKNSKSFATSKVEIAENANNNDATIVSSVELNKNADMQLNSNITNDNNISNNVDNNSFSEMPVAEVSKNTNSNKDNSIIESKHQKSLNIVNSNQISAFPNTSGGIESSLINQFGYDMFYVKNDITLSSTYIQGFAQNGLTSGSNKPVIHYSQSLGFSISESIKIGFEFGLTEFQYDKRSYIYVPISEIDNDNKIGNNIEVLDPIGDNNYIIVPVNVNQNHQLYWGTMFFENNWLSYNGLIIDSRIGIGASNSGYVGFGRINAKYDIYRGIYLTFGTEGRIFSTDALKKVDDNISRSIGFVYGLQFKF